MNRRVARAVPFVLVLWLFGFPPAVGAGGEIYRWIDARGVMHFSNQPPPPGVRILERIAETPHDSVADRERREAEREVLREFERRELEEQKARAEERERQARRRLEEAERRLEEARRLEEQARRLPEDCDREWFLRHGTCEGFVSYSYPVRRIILHGRTPRPDECRDWYRENNSIYCRDPQKPPQHPPEKPPRKGLPDDTRKPPPKAPRATRPPAGEDPAAPRR